jgi:hypothetical protein
MHHQNYRLDCENDASFASAETTRLHSSWRTSQTRSLLHRRSTQRKSRNLRRNASHWSRCLLQLNISTPFFPFSLFYFQQYFLFVFFNCCALIWTLCFLWTWRKLFWSELLRSMICLKLDKWIRFWLLWMKFLEVS